MKPEKDKTYLAFVRTLDCMRCDTPHCSEVSHSGPRGLGQKCSDYFVAPLCNRCHSEFDGRAGISYWNLDKDEAKDGHMLFNIRTMFSYLAKYGSIEQVAAAKRVVHGGGSDWLAIATDLKTIVMEARSRR